ncbi:MAG: adenylate kinase [Anaerolineales bacterium]|nr:adenylate kinase [Chloroflexota bacterium]MBL7162341.1 adenylate kinase [Anaerolineales bacterium]
MAKQIVMLGPPGAGKGTQAKMLSEKLSVPHVSSGYIFRENLREQTELGKHADVYINRGELVPDDVTIAMIRERISRPDCDEGVLLDGFPRTAPQAEALDEMLSDLNKGQVDAVPCITVPDEVLIERLTGRRTCRAQGHVFHIAFNPPKEAGKCDYDGSELYQREDDTVETVTNRIRVYLKQTQPLIDYYQQRGVLLEVAGDQSIDAVFDEIMSALSGV